VDMVVETWWDHDDDDPRGRAKRPTRCSCCCKVTRRSVDVGTEEYTCRVHGLAIVARHEIKRTGKMAWHYSRLWSATPTTPARPLQLTLFTEGATP
jgi:hypothetical protein